MTTEEMDKDLEAYSDAEALAKRLGYWEARLRLSRPNKAEIAEYGEVAKKHALRVAAVMRAG